jgi:hypothetical protein
LRVPCVPLPSLLAIICLTALPLLSKRAIVAFFCTALDICSSAALVVAYAFGLHLVPHKQPHKQAHKAHCECHPLTHPPTPTHTHSPTHPHPHTPTHQQVSGPRSYQPPSTSLANTACAVVFIVVVVFAGVLVAMRACEVERTRWECRVLTACVWDGCGWRSILCSLHTSALVVVTFLSSSFYSDTCAAEPFSQRVEL